MINQLVRVFDNIGFNFTVKSNSFVVGSPLTGYTSLNSSHLGYYIPYLVRNYTDNTIQYEIGVGLVKLDGTTIIVERYKVLKSSNQDSPVVFDAGKKSEFYIFANESNFNTGFNNVLIRTEHFTIEPVSATYLIDSTSGSIDAILPASQDSNNVIIEMKVIAGDNPVIVRDNEGHIILSLNDTNRYSKLCYKNNTWYQLINDTPIGFEQLSVDPDINFSSLANPVGSLYSFQYNNGSDTFAGSNMYWSSGNTNKLLLGADNETGAQHIIPTSGTSSIILNNQHNNSNLIVNGSGNNNLIFTYDGKLGLNVPTGTGPSTIVHVINTICSEILRLENRKNCKETTVTLYHAPSGTATTGIVSTINLAGKDTNNNQLNYSQLQSTSLNVSAGNTKGQFDIIVAGNGSGINTIRTSADSTFIGYNNKLTISNSTNTAILGTSGTYIEVSPNNTNIKSSNIILGTGVNGNTTINGTLNAINNVVVNGNLRLPNLTKNSVLTLDNNGFISANQSNIKFPNVPSGYILSTSDNGSVTGIYKTDDYFLTEKDIIWNKYPQRAASICLRQIALSSPVPMEEFAIGDQIAILSASQTYYRNIISLDIENNTIVGMLINQVISSTEDTSNVEIYSVTKGGYLLMQMHTEPGVSPDASSNIFSIRPLTDTVFNIGHKDINFSVYGVDKVPALSIKSNSGRGSKNSGIYYQYSTQNDREPFSIQISPEGNGINNTNNTANFQYTASGRFVGMVTDVGSNGQSSFYGTYDQNGNVAEWVEDKNKTSLSTIQYAAGGAWTSMSGEALHGLIPANYSGHYSDIGFRICSIDGLVDNLNLEFVTVNDSHNIPDLNTVSILLNNNLVPSGISNLGSINHIYRIGKYEITNTQYAEFLNATATVSDPYGLYHSFMGNTVYGGIARSGTDGSYSYHIKDNMNNKPVNFVSYLSAIRFTNWLHNGAPTNTETFNNSIIENGAYEILSLGNNSYQINKNTYQNYWLPSIHEWHKAAYFMPQPSVSASGTSSVMIKRDDPFIISTGLYTTEYANLSVSGWLYADKLCIGDGSFVSEGGPKGTGIKYISTSGNSISFLNDTMILDSGSYRLKLGNQNNITLNTGKSLWDKTYGNYLSSNSGIELSTALDISLITNSGDIKIYSTGYVDFSGIQADTILYKNLKKIGENGIEEPIYLGSSGSLVYKKDDFTPGTSDQFLFDNTNKLNFPGGERYSPMYVANTGSGMVATYTGVHYLTNSIEIYNPVIMPQIQIGDNKPFFKGNILTHAGNGYATWEPAEYLKADGVLWNRYIKRPVLIYENRFVFDSAVNNGDVDAEQAAIEFGYSDTIALINTETREKTFVKAADDGLHVIDSNGELISVNSEVITTDVKGLGISFCPASPWPLVSGCLPVSGYAYAVNKGGYLTMQLDPTATSGFSCDLGMFPNNGSGYSFKPSTLNTISIRPFTSTAFNLLAEDIDFAIYGAHTTKYHRYDSSIFGLDSNGLPSGLTPVFKVDAINYNAVSGNPQSGVYFSGYLDQNGTQPTGYQLDETGKVCINTKSPYIIDSIPSGTATLNVLSDLTINGYTYSSGLITTELFVRPIPDLNGNGKFVVNAPLTVNSRGQIVSQVPATAPTVPGSPTEVGGESGNGCVTLSWIPPSNNGGRNIINYIIEYSLNSGNSWTTYNKPASIEVSTLITGLTNGVNYIFRVSAVNAIGTGSPSIVTGPITPLAAKPSSPRNLLVSKNNLSRTLSWDAPSITGSSSILAYVLEYSNDYGLTWIVVNNNIGSNIRSYTITGLSNDPTYYIRIKAINDSGSGAYAQSVSIGDDPYIPPETGGNDDLSNIWDFGKILFTGVCT